MKQLLQRFILIQIMLISVSLNIHADDMDKYWENIPSELHERYQLASQRIWEDWVIQFADSLEMKARDIDNANLKMFASQLKSRFDFVKNDSASYIYHNNRTMSLAKEAGDMQFYYMEKLGRVMFYHRNRHWHHALTTVQEILKEAKENNDIQGIYFGYMSMCYFYTAKRSPQQAIEYGLKAAECLDMMEKPNSNSKAYIYNQLAINYLNVRDYENCIKNIKVAIQYNNNLPDMYYTLCKAYYEMGDIQNFKESASTYMAKREQNGFFFTSDYKVIKALLNIADKNYSTAQTYIDSISAKDDKMYCLLTLYKTQNNWQKAYECQEMISDYEDSIALTMFSEEISDMSGELDALYKVKEKDEILIRQRFYMIIAFIIFLAIIILSAIVFLRYRAIKNKNLALAHNIDKLIKYKQKVLELENEKYGRRPAPSLSDEEEEIDDDFNDEEEESNQAEEAAPASATDTPATAEDYTLIERFIYELTSRKLFTDVNFNRDTLIDELHIQKRTFTKKFEAYTGNSFKEYLTALRLEYAAQLIKEHPEYTIEAIAIECGIASYVTFHRNFTRHFGIAPSSYRAQ